MTNPIGIISMQFVRPFTQKDLYLFEKIRTLGFDFIELLIPEPEDDLNLSDVRQALAKVELGIVLAARVNRDRSLASSNPAARSSGNAYLEYCLQVAEKLGANLIGGPLYGEPLVFAGRAPRPIDEAERQQRFNHCVEGLTKAANQANQFGVRLALEPLNRFETDIISTTQQGIHLVDAIDNPALGLLLDTFHMNMEERNLATAIRAAGKRIFHFQANENHRGFVGTGHINWPEIAAALSEIGYEGTVSLEPFRRDDDRIAIPIAQWRPPHEDESEKLIASLQLIRSLLTLKGVVR